MELNEYMVMALALSAVLGLIGALAHPSLSREAEAAIGVVCLFSLASPIVAAVGSTGSLGERLPECVPAVGEGGYIQVSEQAFAEGIEGYISEEFSLPPDGVDAELSGFDFTTMRASGARITLSGAAAVGNIGGIREAVIKNFLSDGGRCEVVIDLG